MGWMLLDRVIGGFITGFIGLIRWWYVALAVLGSGATLLWLAG